MELMLLLFVSVVVLAWGFAMSVGAWVASLGCCYCLVFLLLFFARLLFLVWSFLWVFLEAASAYALSCVGCVCGSSWGSCIIFRC